MRTMTLCLLLLAAPFTARAQHQPDEQQERFRADLGLTVSHFEQQVKTEVGGARGERLVEDTALGLDAFGTWRFWGPLSVGAFVAIDVGNRTAARFDAFDADGAPTVTGRLGGSYAELWVGPVIRAQWRSLFGEIGWGALGLRWDDARTDLRNTSGEADGTLRTSPSIAWRLAIGAAVPVWQQLDLVLRLNYRVRYYTSRGGEDLEGDMVHGTQDLTPFVGAAWRF